MPRVLYVDDDPFTREIVGITLRQIPGLDVALAENGRQALAMTTDSGFDLIILDLVMPDLDGIEVLKALRSRPSTPRTAVAFATARGLEDEYQEMIQLGAVAILAKPIGPSALQREIKSLLELHVA